MPLSIHPSFYLHTYLLPLQLTLEQDVRPAEGYKYLGTTERYEQRPACPCVPCSYLPIYQCMHRYINVCTDISMYAPIYQCMHRYINVCTDPSIHPSTDLSIDPSIYTPSTGTIHHPFPPPLTPTTHLPHIHRHYHISHSQATHKP
jgi:hypothetical protein